MATKKAQKSAEEQPADDQLEHFYPSEIVDIESLKPWPTNYNDHDEGQLVFMRGSLRDFGQFKNVVVWKDFIIAGHGLVEAAKGRGWKRIEVKKLPADWTEAKVEAALIADNRLAEMSSANKELLADMLQRVRSTDGELLDSIGYTTFEVDDLLRELVNAEEPPEDFNEYDETLEVEHTCPSCGFQFS